MSRLHASEFHERMRRVETALDKAGLDALIAYSVGNQPGPVAYLGGYEPRFGLNDVAYFVLVPGTRPTYALLGNAYWDKPATLTWTDHVLVTSNFAQELCTLLPSSAKRVGVAGYNFFPAPVSNALQSAFPNTRFEDATELLKHVAKIKSPAELELVRLAAQISDNGGREFIEGVREGENERALQSKVERAMIAAGADGLAFPTFIMSGPKVAVGIGFAEDRSLVAGEQLNLLCGAQVGGYRVELGRITTVGQPSPEFRRIMDTAADMYEAMLNAVKPGVPAGQVAEASVAVARKQNLDAYLFKSINSSATQGHGMGCWVSEPPPIHPLETGLIEENMALSLEARLCLPNFGGAVITEMVKVTPNGAERLSSLPVRLWEA